MNYFLGIDGGGTKTKCVLVNKQLNELAKTEGASFNPLIVGFEKSAEIIISLIKDACAISKISGGISVVIGIAGGGRKVHSEQLKKEIFNNINKTSLILKNLEILSDAEIALEGALSGKAGTILIAGTGSILFGKDKNGNTFRVGGFGRLIGDEGSGYAISKKGLAAAAKAFDKRVRETILKEYLAIEYKINNKDELITEIYSNNFDIAGFAPYVIRAAQKGDKISRKIINEEIDELLLHIKAIKNNFAQKKILLSFGGSLVTEKNYYSNELKRRIRSKYKEIKICRSKYPPEIGAAIIAQRLFSNNSNKSSKS